MKHVTAGRAVLFLVRVVLLAFELSMRAIAGAFDATVSKRRFHGNKRVRTAAGTIEPVAYDEFGRRVGAVSGSPAVKDL